MVPASTAPPASPAEPDKAKKTSRYIRWSELLRRVFGIEILCKKCKAPLRLIALIKSEDVAKKILTLCRARHKTRYVECRIMWSCVSDDAVDPDGGMGDRAA